MSAGSPGVRWATGAGANGEDRRLHARPRHAQSRDRLWASEIASAKVYTSYMVLPFFVNPIGASVQAWGTIATIRGPLS